MFKVEKTKIGKILQIKKGLKQYLSGNYTIVQTFGRRVENSVACWDRLMIKEVLMKCQDRDLVIVSPSTMNVDEEFVGWMRFFTYSGYSVYIYSLNGLKKVWYADGIV